MTATGHKPLEGQHQPEPPGENPKPAASGMRRRVLIVTGLSGSGRSTALRALEDIGYEAIDNLPLSLLSEVLLPGRHDRRQQIPSQCRN